VSKVGDRVGGGRLTPGRWAARAQVSNADLIMGRVLIHSEGVRIPGVYSAENITYRIYCDKCGSFWIKSHYSVRLWVPLSLLALIALSVFYNKPVQSPPFGTVFCLGVLLFLLLVMTIHESGHKCKRCGNTYITDGNVRSYPECDDSVLDVPDALTHKHSFCEIQ
jgi:hypothetical protein